MIMYFLPSLPTSLDLPTRSWLGSPKKTWSGGLFPYLYPVSTHGRRGFLVQHCFSREESDSMATVLSVPSLSLYPSPHRYPSSFWLLNDGRLSPLLELTYIFPFKLLPEEDRQYFTLSSFDPWAQYLSNCVFGFLFNFFFSV